MRNTRRGFAGGIPRGFPLGTTPYKTRPTWLNFAELGGGNGIVFNANKMVGFGNTGEPCAIKLLRQQGAARIDRFNNEIRVLKSLTSPFIAKYHDDGRITVTSQADKSQTQEVRWLAMELGAANMRHHVEHQGPLNLSSLKRATADICEAVSHLHSKWLYPSGH